MQKIRKKSCESPEKTALQMDRELEKSHVRVLKKQRYRRTE